MISIESPSLTMHNVTIVTRLRSPNIYQKNPQINPTLQKIILLT